MADYACCVGWMVIFPIIVIALNILMGAWAYKDAEERGKNGVLWFLIVFLLSIIGLGVWLLVRPKDEELAGTPPPGQPPMQPPPQQPT